MEIISVELSIHYLRVQVSHTEVFGSNSERKAILKKGLNLIHTTYLAMQAFDALSNVIWFCEKEKKKDSEFVITIGYEYQVVI